jgi:hypothetical protein
MITFGRWSEPGLPHTGWRCIGVEDLGEPAHLCEMCEAMVVRYVHSMEHDDWPDVLDVGCVCAGNMESDPIGARRRETALKGRHKRRLRWLSDKRWCISAAGNDFINTADGFNVVVYARGVIWGARVEHRPSGYQRASRRPYRTSDEAKLAAFDAMLGLKASKPWMAPS